MGGGAASPMNKGPDNSPFFVVGSDRSGTTMFRLMLNEHSRLHIPRESWFLMDLMDNLPLQGELSGADRDRAFTLISTHGRWKDWPSSDEDLARVFRSLEGATLAELIDSVFRGCGNLEGKPRWGDKTPKYIDEVRRLCVVFPGAKFVHVIRDGRDVCMSLRGFRWQGESIYSIAEYWRDVIFAGKQAEQLLGPEAYLEINYEDIVLEPEASLRLVCRFLGEEYEDRMLDFYENAAENIADFEKDKGIHTKTMRAPRAEDTCRWKTEMRPIHVAMFESVAGGAMKIAGQERRFRGLGRVLPLLCATFIGMIKATRPLRQRLGIQFPGLRRKM